MGRIYAVPTVEMNTSSGRREVSLDALNLSKRKIFLTGGINTELADNIIMELMWLRETSEEPVNLYINSPGGEVNSGLAVYDAIQQIDILVNEICIMENLYGM